MATQLLDDLTAVAELLANWARWTKGCDALNQSGVACSADDPGAVCWCLRGACKMVADGSDYRTPRFRELISALESVLLAVPHYYMDCKNRTLVSFNDYDLTTHADVLHLVGRAIERCKRGDAVPAPRP